jgi:uncharacterized membrane protein YoaK (UPF0700 family)
LTFGPEYIINLRHNLPETLAKSRFSGVGLCLQCRRCGEGNGVERSSKSLVWSPTVATDAVLVLLSGASGWLDATAYLRVHVFTANMSGNSILFALGLGRRPPGKIVEPACAIAAFAFGALLGNVAGQPDDRLKAAARVLFIELLVLACFAGLWLTMSPDVYTQRVLIIGVASFAMGLQQAATQRLHPRPPVSTTYMSGTLERIGAGLQALAEGRPGKVVFNGLLWLVYLVAAFGVAVASFHHDALLGIVPLLVILAVTVALGLVRNLNNGRKHDRTHRPQALGNR